MDYIHRGAETTQKQFGGILYSLVSLAAITKGKATIYPIMNLGEDEYDNVIRFLNTIGNIDLTYINKTSHRTRVVNLFYKDKDSVLNVSTKKTYDREENSTEPTLPVEYEQIKDLLPKLDGILVNLVSGVDLELGSFQKLRGSFKGYIHMDLHNLVMQTFPDGTRKQMPVKDWQSWVSLPDTLQMNESELNVLTGENVTEYDTAKKILSGGSVRALAVTRGRSGVSLFSIRNNNSYTSGELDKLDVPRINSADFVDSTGCGDVFASSFFYKNAEKKLADIPEALNFANKMASKNSSLHGVEDLPKLTE